MIEVKGITIDKKWKWMAKDETGLVYAYENIPIKKEYIYIYGSEQKVMKHII